MVFQCAIGSTKQVNELVRCPNFLYKFKTPIVKGDSLVVLIKGQLKNAPVESSHNRNFTTARRLLKAHQCGGASGLCLY